MSETLKVLMITHHRRSKTRFRAHAMAKHLIQRGHNVTLMAIAEQRKVGIVGSEWDGVYTVETPDLLWGQLRSGWDVWDLVNRTAYLRRSTDTFDIVHCFETRPATIYPALSYCRDRQLPFLTDWNDWWGRGGIIDELRPAWYRALFGGIETYYEEAFRTKAAGATVISSALARRAAGLGLAEERICHLPGGTLPEFFQARSKEACRARVGLPASTQIIGFSSLDSHLDLDIVLQALSIVVKQFPDARLLVTGTPSKSLVERARARGVERNLHLTGFLPYEILPWYLGCADLFVLPFAKTNYNIGRWPNKIGDYMSLGRPTVTNAVGDIKTLFEQHEIGLTSLWEPEDFARKIVYLLQCPDAADELGARARRLAETVYDWRLLIVRLEEFYRFLLYSSHAKR